MHLSGSGILLFSATVLLGFSIGASSDHGVKGKLNDLET